MEESSWQEIMSYYVDLGVVELEGMDQSGEPIYSIKESAKELAPELWESHMEHINKALEELYKDGLIEVDYDENLEPRFKISPEGYIKAKEYGLIEFPDGDIPND